ncbi:NAD(P)H-binding protein [Nocardia beijingensis]|uniref:NAD(P)H-binding protein n=1 Tax=Nocardia beijingensis TaxID=95162 RepID=UPI001894EE38|nr:NAD(P)H-binding protein [Nocardia beijingensis]MBF6465505.1 NAD(P)H-binding protein [Nocardia beijingensis]
MVTDRQLSERGTAIRAVTRDPDRARVPAGVEVVRGDYTDLASMAKAMAGAEAAFIVGVLGPEYVELDRALITTARDAGVGRIVKLSAIGTGDTGLGRVGTWHLPGEQAARESGVDWTILRPSSFASNTLSWAAAIRAGQPVPNMTGDAAQGVVDPRDVAGAAVEALISADHAGRIYHLTGPELLTTHDLAATLATVTGHPVGVTDIPETEARAHMLASGMSAEYADGALAGQAYVRAGHNAIVTADIIEILGRARSFAEWAADNVNSFTAAGNTP